MALKFGTSGVRGLVTELTDSEVWLFTTAFLTYAKSLNQIADVALAHDLRESSPRLQMAAIKAIQDFGQKPFSAARFPPRPLLTTHKKKIFSPS
ncbi:MAG: hypothetical protein IPM97_04715 [Bdellovibrionaceae bacterium]|nr:hypothetical protein [Pseudobdellovibrionaceae bacterium]